MPEKRKTGNRSGSEKRRRTHMFTVRFSNEEAAKVRLHADRAGTSIAGLLRQSLLGADLPRAARRPTINHRAVAKLMGQLGKIGSNINQLAKQANAGRYQENTIELALRDLMELRLACLQALGKEPKMKE